MIQPILIAGRADFFYIFPGDRVGEGAILARKLVNDDYFYAIEAIN